MRQPVHPSVFFWERSAAIIAASYFVIAALWILGSDRLSAILAQGDPQISLLLQNTKGIAFVLVTSIGLYLTLAWANARRRRLADEKRLVEEMLSVAQRLEALGTLAGTLAHDFNNALTLITANTHWLRHEGADAQLRTARLEEIDRATQQAGQLVRELMLFMRNAPLTFTEGDLGELVRREWPLLQQAATRAIAMELIVEERLPPVRLVPAQVERTLLNLVLNARDALQQAAAKRIVVRVAARQLKQHVSLYCPQPTDGDFVTISVQDTGCGIPRENLVRIFSPFFTTKPEGQGTGLGLTSTMRVMQTHHGWVEIDSAPGCGACFTLFFPVRPLHDTTC